MQFVVSRTSQPQELVSGLVAESLPYRLPGYGPGDDYVPASTEMRMASVVDCSTTEELVQLMQKFAVDFDYVPVGISVRLPQTEVGFSQPLIAIHNALDEL